MGEARAAHVQHVVSVQWMPGALMMRRRMMTKMRMSTAELSRHIILTNTLTMC